MLATRLRRVNFVLHKLGLTFHSPLPIYAIDSALVAGGFSVTREWTRVSNTEMKVHEEVGDGKWFSVSAYKMDSGNWEVVAYVN